MHDDEHIAEHDLFIQYVKLKNTLRQLIGEETIDFID
jgi:myo-inositol-1-phosphate synthase